ncbi:MAG TPA: TRAP transporter small permease [Myxococcota bacterium]|nr:TRAP transporter small permease [Myxococcota bacterium]HOA14397.1 TRAP transporter small permease [Myxococcota bacterium]HOH77772.1 TRAP transporter small permease [Myxococcota bacterium]HPV04950.1 TRAP transporter small permease [Myxococcota bacterium]
MNPIVKAIRAFDTALSRVETVAIVVVVAAMMLLTTGHVVLKLAGLGVIQLEEAARYLVIWVGFLGGSVAAYQSRHINIDILTRFIKGVPKRVSLCLVWLIGVGITVVLAKTAISYVGDLKEAGGIAIAYGDPGSELQVPEWILAVIMPAGLILIAWHMLAGAVYAALGMPGPGHDAAAAAAGKTDTGAADATDAADVVEAEADAGTGAGVEAGSDADAADESEKGGAA